MFFRPVSFIFAKSNVVCNVGYRFFLYYTKYNIIKIDKYFNY